MLLSFAVRKSRETRRKLRRYVELREGFIKSEKCLYTLEMEKLMRQKRRTDGVMSFIHDNSIGYSGKVETGLR